MSYNDNTSSEHKFVSESGNTIPVFSIENTVGYSKFYITTATPESSINTDIGGLAIDSVNGNFYIKKGISGTNTEWFNMSSSSSSSTPLSVTNTIFENNNRFIEQLIGAGITTFGTTGVEANTLLNGDGVDITLPLISQNLLNGNPTFYASIRIGNLNAAGQFFIGIGIPVGGGSFNYSTIEHIGLKIDLDTVEAKYTQSDGSSESEGIGFTVGTNTLIELFCVISSATSITYYRRLNGGTLSSGYTISTNVPTFSTGNMGFGMANTANGSNTIHVRSMSHSR